MSGIAAFSRALSSSSSSPCWNTKPKCSRRSRARSSADSSWTATEPSAAWKRTCPESGTDIPARAWSSVVFPEPEGPVIATDSPGAIVRLTPSRAAVDP